MKRLMFVIIIVLLFCLSLVDAAEDGRPILKEIGVARGICVLLGDTKCELAVKLARESELLIYVQLPRAQDVETARRTVDEAGLYGTRIFVEKGSLKSLHLTNNIADALVAVGKVTNISEKEALRVLRPGGKAVLGRKVLIKPLPEGADDWSHPYHGPDNNPPIERPYNCRALSDPVSGRPPLCAGASDDSRLGRPGIQGIRTRGLQET